MKDKVQRIIECGASLWLEPGFLIDRIHSNYSRRSKSLDPSIKAFHFEFDDLDVFLYIHYNRSSTSAMKLVGYSSMRIIKDNIEYLFSTSNQPDIENTISLYVG